MAYYNTGRAGRRAPGYGSGAAMGAVPPRPPFRARGRGGRRGAGGRRLLSPSLDGGAGRAGAGEPDILGRRATSRGPPARRAASLYAGYGDEEEDELPAPPPVYGGRRASLGSLAAGRSRAPLYDDYEEDEVDEYDDPEDDLYDDDGYPLPRGGAPEYVLEDDGDGYGELPAPPPRPASSMALTRTRPAAARGGRAGALAPSRGAAMAPAPAPAPTAQPQPPTQRQLPPGQLEVDYHVRGTLVQPQQQPPTSDFTARGMLAARMEAARRRALLRRYGRGITAWQGFARDDFLSRDYGWEPDFEEEVPYGWGPVYRPGWW